MTKLSFKFFAPNSIFLSWCEHDLIQTQYYLLLTLLAANCSSSSSSLLKTFVSFHMPFFSPSPALRVSKVLLARSFSWSFFHSSRVISLGCSSSLTSSFSLSSPWDLEQFKSKNERLHEAGTTLASDNLDP